MKPDCNNLIRKVLSAKALLKKVHIIFTLSFFVSLNAFSQYVPYYPIVINADVEDTVKVTPCRLPYKISKKKPDVGDSISWKVIKGTANLSSLTSFNTEVKDMKMDTCLLTYSIYSSTKVLKSVDSLLLVNDKFQSCYIIERGTMGSVSCGTPITLHSKIRDNFEYHFSWFSDGGTVIDNSLSLDPVITFSTPGIHYVNVIVRSNFGYNIITDMMTFNVTCSTTPVTKANAGPDKTLSVCQFPIDLVGNIPAFDETVKWEILGVGSIQSPFSSTAKLLDIKNGTKIRYIITKGTLTSIDTMVVYVNSGDASICNPVISNENPVCGDSVSINFEWGEKKPGFVPYTFAWTFPTGVAPASAPKNKASMKILTSGTYQIKVQITSPYNFNTFERVITLNATCPSTITKANAGTDTLIAPCQFPITLKGNAPVAGETVKWEYLPSSGMAILMGKNSQNLMVVDATNGVKLIYTISNGTQESSDTMVIKVDQTNLYCNPIVSNLAPACGESVRIEFPFAAISANNYMWTLPSGVRELSNTGNAIEVAVDNAGVKEIVVTFKTLFGYNTITKRVFLSPKCITQANAGPDAFAYCNQFQLSGNKVGAGESGTWSIIKGNAVIADVHNPTTTISGFTSDTLKLVWSITNTSSQKSSDTVVIAVRTLTISNFNVVNASCGKSDGNAEVFVGGGLPPYTIQWQGGISGSQIANVPAGNYRVIVKDQSGCQVADTISIKDNCNVSTSYILEGNVYAGNQLLPYGFAMLMQNIGGLPITVKTANVVNGYYKFTGVEKGEYTVYVLPYKDKSLTDLHDQYLPTFYVNKVSILYANHVIVSGNTYSVDIKLVEKQPANYGANSITATINFKSGQSAPMLPVLLYNLNDELVGSAYFDGSTVEFDNLAAGNYYLSVPVEGEGYKKTQVIQVLSDESIELNFENGKITNTMEEQILNSIKAYPNPFSELVTIDFGKMDGTIQLRILEAVTGREVKSIDNVSGSSYQLITEELPSGFYILQISNGDSSKNVSMIKM